VVFSFDGDEAGRRAARKALDGALPYATDVRTVKFLFLPADHDPDSYIREFGREGFSRYVSEATPLSRFLIEAAREGCDLSTAEGRAHMAANAKPLWSQLPDGALRRQLLGEIAAHVQVEARELASLWAISPAAVHSPGQKPAWAARRDSAPKPPSRRLGIRPSIEASASNIARLLLANARFWEVLGSGEHEILCALEGDFGDLFRWIDNQVHEHGPQPLAALAVGLQGQSFEAVARRIIALDNLQPSGRLVEDPETPLADLHSAVLKLQLDVLDLELKRVQALPPSDAGRVGQEEQLIRRQFALKKRQTLEKM
jgi:DNA primase